MTSSTAGTGASGCNELFPTGGCAKPKTAVAFLADAVGTDCNNQRSERFLVSHRRGCFQSREPVFNQPVAPQRDFGAGGDLRPQPGVQVRQFTTLTAWESNAFADRARRRVFVVEQFGELWPSPAPSRRPVGPRPAEPSPTAVPSAPGRNAGCFIRRRAVDSEMPTVFAATTNVSPAATRAASVSSTRWRPECGTTQPPAGRHVLAGVIPRPGFPRDCLDPAAGRVAFKPTDGGRFEFGQPVGVRWKFATRDRPGVTSEPRHQHEHVADYGVVVSPRGNVLAERHVLSPGPAFRQRENSDIPTGLDRGRGPPQFQSRKSGI